MTILTKRVLTTTAQKAATVRIPSVFKSLSFFWKQLCGTVDFFHEGSDGYDDDD